MRVLIAAAAVLSASLATALPAAARQQKQARTTDYSASRAQKSDYYHYRGKSARGDAHDCVRAESLDPAGNYKAYPCWARAAFAPKEVR